MKNRAVLLIAVAGICLLPFFASAQGQKGVQPVEERLVYGYERSASVVLHSQGLGLGYLWARIHTSQKTSFFGIELVSFSSLKEVSMYNPYVYLNGSSFIYGKLNSVFDLRCAYGQSFQFTRKPSWGGVEIRWKYAVGASIASLKPYYYYFEVIDAATSDIILQEGRFDDESIVWIDIYGRCPYSKGINEMRLSPGVGARLSLAADFAKSRTRIRTLEVSVMAEYFPLNVPIMYAQKNERLFVTFGLSYSFGVRYNKY